MYLVRVESAIYNKKIKKLHLVSWGLGRVVTSEKAKQMATDEIVSLSDELTPTVGEIVNKAVFDIEEGSIDETHLVGYLSFENDSIIRRDDIIAITLEDKR